ncbi:50S ribosomal protein L16 [Candidatus Woesearchaeota archaeon]|nr:50S ribosomal protein L16 [Candidatus Woesearchaeota archaeon]
MVTLRKGSCYSKITRPWTRKSKYKKKGFIKAIPTIKVVRYTMGDPKKEFNYTIKLISKKPHQIRHNALESSRQIVNRALNEKVGPSNYLFQINAYPHHVLRENRMLSGAHADRLQTGMSHSFGKAMGTAAQVPKGKVVFTVKVNKEFIDLARVALKTATPRLPGTYTIEIT